MDWVDADALCQLAKGSTCHNIRGEGVADLFDPVRRAACHGAIHGAAQCSDQLERRTLNRQSRPSVRASDLVVKPHGLNGRPASVELGRSVENSWKFLYSRVPFRAELDPEDTNVGFMKDDRVDFAGWMNHQSQRFTLAPPPSNGFRIAAGQDKAEGRRFVFV